MRMIIATLVILIATVLIDSVHNGAKADPYRWCAQYRVKGATNCYFLNLAQCQAAISGNGGFCVPNNFYDGRPVTTPEDRGGRALR